MDALQVLRELRCHELQGEMGTDFHTLGFPYAVPLAEIADHGIVVIGRIKPGHGCWTGSRTLAAGRSQASVDVDHHMKLLFIVVNHRRI